MLGVRAVCGEGEGTLTVEGEWAMLICPVRVVYWALPICPVPYGLAPVTDLMTLATTQDNVAYVHVEGRPYPQLCTVIIHGFNLSLKSAAALQCPVKGQYTGTQIYLDGQVLVYFKKERGS